MQVYLWDCLVIILSIIHPTYGNNVKLDDLQVVRENGIFWREILNLVKRNAEWIETQSTVVHTHWIEVCKIISLNMEANKFHYSTFFLNWGRENLFKRMAEYKWKIESGGASHCSAPHINRVISNAMEQKLLIFVVMEWNGDGIKKRSSWYMHVLLISEMKKQSAVYESAYLLDKNLCWSDKDLEMENSCGNSQILCVFAFSPSLHFITCTRKYEQQKKATASHHQQCEQ